MLKAITMRKRCLAQGFCRSCRVFCAVWTTSADRDRQRPTIAARLDEIQPTPCLGFLTFFKVPFGGYSERCRLVSSLRDVAHVFSTAGANIEPLDSLAHNLVRLVHIIAHLPVVDPASASVNVPIASLFKKGTNVSAILNEGLHDYKASELVANASLTPHFFAIVLREVR